MTTTTTTLVDFLTARLDEDEVEARRRVGHLRADADGRVLREVEAKRRVVALHSAVLPFPSDGPQCLTCTTQGNVFSQAAGLTVAADWPCPTLRALASVYSDHPDYDPAWA